MKLSLVALMTMITMAAFGQEGGKWWMKDFGYSFQLPDSWASDPFSTSSVCDCQGTISDNGGFDEEYLGMVIYPANAEHLHNQKRQEVWDYTFVPNEEKQQEVMYGKYTYLLSQGVFDGSKTRNKAWRLEMTSEPGKKKPYLMIYFWGSPENFDKNEAVFKDILSSLKLTRWESYDEE